MKLDVSVHEGRADLPACVFVHGLGLNKFVWTDPSLARVMGGLFPLKKLLKGHHSPRTLYHDLMEAGYTVVAWSQRRPVGPAWAAVEELKEVMAKAGRINTKGVVLIGHSRGGLVSRAVTGNPSPPVKCLITLSTPHMGTGMARWAGFLSPLASRFNRLLPEAERGMLGSSIKRTHGFIESTGVKELLPGSGFLHSLPAAAPDGACCLSVGGTDPSLIRVPGLMPLPEGLESILSPKVLPEEMRRDRGDGLVSARSAVMPFADEHLDFPVNHLTVIFDPAVRNAVLEKITRHHSA
jgi:pimeloyl-ACP methyl ester carboxylesterase